MAKEYGIGYNRYGLEYQPSMNTLQSNYDMWMKFTDGVNNPEKAKTFIGNAFSVENAVPSIIAGMDILPNLFDINPDNYMPGRPEERNYIGMQGAYNLNADNPTQNGGKVKKRSKDKALNPQMKANKYYPNNY